jgi:methionyl-tRNA formyltransferase
MRLVFAGTPEFAAASLSALHDAGHEIALVLTQPDRPAGRGLKPLPSPVKRLAETLKLPVRQPHTLKDEDIRRALLELVPEVMIVAAYGLILPISILEIPAGGGVNIHASLLPRWRGAAPIQRALLAGDAETGISIMQMDAGLDTGPVLLQEAFPIRSDDTAQTLHDRLAALGARLIVEALASAHPAVPQDDGRATYAAKIDKSEARLDWTQTAARIDRKVRAFNPVPGAWTTYRGSPLKVWRVLPGGSASAVPGTVCSIDADGVTVAAGEGTALKLLELQRAGGKRLPAAAFLAGSSLAAGERLGA